MSEYGVTMQIRETAEEVGSSVREEVAQTRQEGARELRSQLDRRTTEVGRQACSFARELRRSGDSLRAQGESDLTARLTSGLADGIERTGRYLEHARGDDLLGDVEDFARRRPWLVAGAAALAGFAASRFLKASSERRYENAYAIDPEQRRGWPARPSEAVTSTGHPAPPTVTVGPAGTSPAHAH